MPHHAYLSWLSCFSASPDRPASGLEKTPLVEPRPAVPHPSCCRGRTPEQRGPALSSNTLAGEEGTWRK